MRLLVSMSVLFLSATISHAAFVHRLKPFRAYYMARQIVPLSHQYGIWLHDGNTWKEYLLGLSNRNQINRLQSTDFQPVRADGTEPGSSWSPPKFRKLSSLILKKTKRLFPGQSVKLAYLGYASRVRLTEVIPQEPDRGRKMMSFVSEAEFDVNPDEVIHRSHADHSSLALIEGTDLPHNATLLDFSRSPKVEGSSLLAVNEVTNAMDGDYTRLLDSIQAFARGHYAAFDNEQTASRLFARQGNESVPPLFDQALLLNFKINSRATSNSTALTEAVYFALSSREALSGRLICMERPC